MVHVPMSEDRSHQPVRDGKGEEKETGNAAPTSERVQVWCNGYQGWLELNTLMVHHGEQTMAPTAFERYCGKGASKKWRTSVWKIDQHGNREQTIGSYLIQRGLHVTIATRRSKGAKLKRKPIHTNVDAQDPFAWEEIPEHQTPEPLPPMEAGREPPILKFNLKGMSGPDLAKIAAHTQREDPNQNVLDVPPPVLRNNLPKPEDVDVFSKPGVSKVYALGHSKSDNMEKRAVQQGILADSQEAYQAIYEHIFGKAEAPWDVINHGIVPKLFNKDLDLQMLFLAVQEEGGYDVVTLNNLWSTIAMTIGCQEQAATSAVVLEGLYRKYLLAFQKRWEEEQGGEEEDAADEDDASEGNAVGENLGEQTGLHPEMQQPSTSMDVGTDVDGEVRCRRASVSETRAGSTSSEEDGASTPSGELGGRHSTAEGKPRLEHGGKAVENGMGFLKGKIGMKTPIFTEEGTSDGDSREEEAPEVHAMVDGKTQVIPSVCQQDDEGRTVQGTRNGDSTDVHHTVGTTFPAQEIIVVDCDSDSDVAAFF